MTLGDKLRNLREGKNIKQKDLGHFLQLSQKSISNYERNVRQPNNDILKKLADFFSVSTDFLLGTSVSKASTDCTLRVNDRLADFCYFSIDSTIKIPVVGEISAGTPILAQENIIDYVYVYSNVSRYDQYFALKVIGDSMNLSQIVENNIVIVKRQDIVENGEIAVVLLNGETATIKKFYANNTIVTLVPNSTNPFHQPRIIDLTKIKVNVLGKVIHSIVTF